MDTVINTQVEPEEVDDSPLSSEQWVKITTTYDAFTFWGFEPSVYTTIDQLALEEPTLSLFDAPARIMERLNVSHEVATEMIAAWADRAWIAKGGTVTRIHRSF